MKNGKGKAVANRVGTYEEFERVRYLILEHFKLRDTLKRLSRS